MTGDQLARLLQATTAARAAEDHRVRTIAELNEEGVGLRELARAIGMTHPGVRKIVQRHNEKGAA